MSPSFRGAACRAPRRLLPWLLLPALAACDPGAGGRGAGPLESWFRGPGPDEYLLALEAREAGFAQRDGRAGDTAWTAWVSEGRPLRIEERVEERVDAQSSVSRYTYYGDATLAAIRVTRRDGARPADSLLLAVDFAGDSVWRVRWRGSAALAPVADSTTWPADELARLEAAARRRIAWLDSLDLATRRAARSADSARGVDSARAADSARARAADSARARARSAATGDAPSAGITDGRDAVASSLLTVPAP